MCGGDCVSRASALCLYFDVIGLLSSPWLGLHLLSSTEAEMGDEELHGVGLLSLKQVGAKHQC